MTISCCANKEKINYKYINRSSNYVEGRGMSAGTLMTAITSFIVGFGIGVGIAKNFPVKNCAAVMIGVASIYGIFGLYVYTREMSLAIDEEEERDRVKKSE